MKILAIETSCDETALALAECELNSKIKTQKSKLWYPARRDEFNFKILAEAVASQVKIHRPFGGVVPNLAKREHIKNLPILFQKLFSRHPERSSAKRSGVEGSHQRADKIPRRSAPRNDRRGIDLIAVTVGPGLEPALWTGINFANDLGKKLKVPVVGVNHLEGHIFSNWLPSSPVILSSDCGRDEGSHCRTDKILSSSARWRTLQNDTSVKIAFPAIVLLVSGGHTILLKMDGIKRWKKLGETRDDAVGEAFDKVAKMLGLPYPGGPKIEKLAAQGSPAAILFPRPMINSKNYDFSFSGLKTAILYFLRDNSLQPTTYKLQANIAASFQQAAIDVLVKKTTRAAKEFEAKSILLCGGVACNKALQNTLRKEIASSPRFRGTPRDDGDRHCEESEAISFHVPELKYNTDNAVMIAAAACLGNHYPADKALPDLNL